MDPEIPVAVRSAVSELLASGYPKIGRTARDLGINVRTLQRRLHAAGINYTQLVDNARCEMACRLLERPDVRIGDIATALGYADPSSFSRAFARWTGSSPKTHRCLKAGRGEPRQHR